ncbi:MAG TPA: ribonuclease T [Gammaproteobacteria bacterium]|nr:ribonuclease T [Gammaproteobacteria bacterium]
MNTLAERFRGYLPVVVDVETGGLDPATDALLEIALVLIEIESDGALRPAETLAMQVEPFAGARIVEKSLEITGIDPTHPLRPALPEHEALLRLFRPVRRALRESGCTRAVLVGHNAFFDLAFLNAAVARSDIKRNPFHPFTSFDTATLAGVFLGQTVLARALEVAGIPHDPDAAHSAAYDAAVTAELFCLLVNRCRSVSRPYSL